MLVCMPNNAFKIYAIAKSKYSNSIEKVAIVSTDGINKTKCIENRLSAQWFYVQYCSVLYLGTYIVATHGTLCVATTNMYTKPLNKH